MVSVPEELSGRAIAEMEVSFGFTEGVAENFHTTMQIAMDSQRSFLGSLPDQQAALPVPLANFRQIRPERRAKLVKSYEESAKRIGGAKSANEQFLHDSHRLRLGTFFRIDGRLSAKTADELADWIVANIQ